MPVRLVASPARLEMVMIRPRPAFFMPGVTAFAKRKAPVRLTSTMSRKSSASTSSTGRGRFALPSRAGGPPPPAPPARHIDEDADEARGALRSAHDLGD